VENFKNKLRLIGFVPIGCITNGIALTILFAMYSLFFEWTIFDFYTEPQQVAFDDIAIVWWLINVPCMILGYKVSHIIKPNNLTNKKFIITQLFFIGLVFVLSIGGIFYKDNFLLGLIFMLTEITVLILMIKDRRFNLFNMS
tara:strand:- start:31 stop:456 length:426 start_codon:yes stop_codon:yes gene_type:complete